MGNKVGGPNPEIERQREEEENQSISDSSSLLAMNFDANSAPPSPSSTGAAAAAAAPVEEAPPPEDPPSSPKKNSRRKKSSGNPSLPPPPPQIAPPRSRSMSAGREKRKKVQAPRRLPLSKNKYPAAQQKDSEATIEDQSKTKQIERSRSKTKGSKITEEKQETGLHLLSHVAASKPSAEMSRRLQALNGEDESESEQPSAIDQPIPRKKRFEKKKQQEDDEATARRNLELLAGTAEQQTEELAPEKKSEPKSPKKKRGRPKKKPIEQGVPSAAVKDVHESVPLPPIQKKKRGRPPKKKAGKEATPMSTAAIEGVADTVDRDKILSETDKGAVATEAPPVAPTQTTERRSAGNAEVAAEETSLGSVSFNDRGLEKLADMDGIMDDLPPAGSHDWDQEPAAGTSTVARKETPQALQKKPAMPYEAVDPSESEIIPTTAAALPPAASGTPEILGRPRTSPNVSPRISHARASLPHDSYGADNVMPSAVPGPRVSFLASPTAAPVFEHQMVGPTAIKVVLLEEAGEEGKSPAPPPIPTYSIVRNGEEEEDDFESSSVYSADTMLTRYGTDGRILLPGENSEDENTAAEQPERTEADSRVDAQAVAMSRGGEEGQSTTLLDSRAATEMPDVDAVQEDQQLNTTNNSDAPESEVPADSTPPAVAPVKRKRGRPRKNPLKEGQSTSLPDSSAVMETPDVDAGQRDQQLNTSAVVAPVKRKRGRPRKNSLPATGTSEAAPVQRKPGRPRKVQVNVQPETGAQSHPTVVQKKKRGRPPKNKDANEAVGPGQVAAQSEVLPPPKKKRGRPRKNPLPDSAGLEPRLPEDAASVAKKSTGISYADDSFHFVGETTDEVGVSARAPLPPTPPRKRERPPKAQALGHEAAAPPQKRKRGRPRKNPLPPLMPDVESEQHLAMPPPRMDGSHFAASLPSNQFHPHDFGQGFLFNGHTGFSTRPAVEMTTACTQTEKTKARESNDASVIVNLTDADTSAAQECPNEELPGMTTDDGPTKALAATDFASNAKATEVSPDNGDSKPTANQSEKSSGVDNNGSQEVSLGTEIAPPNDGNADATSHIKPSSSAESPSSFNHLSATGPPAISTQVTGEPTGEAPVVSNLIPFSAVTVLSDEGAADVTEIGAVLIGWDDDPYEVMARIRKEKKERREREAEAKAEEELAAANNRGRKKTPRKAPNKKKAAKSKKEKRPKPEKKDAPKQVFSGPPTEPLEGGWPDGWTKRVFERKSGACKGRGDPYWYSPANKKIRSMVEVKRFLAALQTCNGDEDQAWKVFKKS